MKKKSFLPKNIKELEDIHYKPNRATDKWRYETHLDSHVIDKIREDEAKRILERFGKSEKIPRGVNQTPDYRIQDSKIVYEITSIQVSKDERITQLVRPRSEQDFIADINEKVEHALQKNYSEYLDYIRGVVIFMDEILTSLTDYGEYSLRASLIEQTIFRKSDMAFMIITPIPHSTNKKLVYVAYVKDDKLYKMFEENLPKRFKIIRM